MPRRRSEKFLRAEADRRGVEAIARVGQRQCIGPLEAQRRRLGAGPGEHLLGEVAGDHLAVRRDGAGERDREVAGAGGHVDHAAPRSDPGQLNRPLAPAVMQPRGHHRVHRVVDAGDAIEHRPHLARFQRPGRTAGHYFRSERNATTALNCFGGRRRRRRTASAGSG